MTWPAARAELVTLLEAVAITTPIAQTLARVYPYPVETYQDLPCLVLHSSPLVPRYAVSLVHKERVIPIELLLIDADQARAVELVEAYQDAILDVLIANLTLNGNAANVPEPTFSAGESGDINGVPVVSMTFALTVRLTEAATFAP